MLAMLAAMTVVAAPDPTVLRPNSPLLRQNAPTAACKSHGSMQASDPALGRRDDRVRLRPLAELPKPNLEKAVLRSVNGCAAPVVVSYSVGP